MKLFQQFFAKTLKFGINTPEVRRYNMFKSHLKTTIHTIMCVHVYDMHIYLCGHIYIIYIIILLLDLLVSTCMYVCSIQYIHTCITCSTMCTVTTYIVHVHVIFYRVSPSTCAQFVIVLVSMVQKKCSANIGTCVHMCTHVCNVHTCVHTYVCMY